MNYTGIKVKNASSSSINALKIASGAHDIFLIGAASASMQDPDHSSFSSASGSGASADTVADVLLISVTVDVANKVVSGYDANGNRYIIDKEADISLILEPSSS